MPSDLSGWFGGDAAPYWIGAGAALCVAVLAGAGDWRRKRRVDLDRVGLVDWPTVQMFAVIVAAVFVIVAMHD